jgi:hypothetical protein
MFAGDWRHVHVDVMLVVVVMRVLVREGTMAMRVRMPFGKMQHEDTQHRCERDSSSPFTERFAEKHRDRCCHEWIDCEERRWARRSHASLREEVQAKAQAVARGAVSEQAEAGCR